MWNYDLCISCRHCHSILSRDTNGTLRPISTLLPVFIPSLYSTSSQKFSSGFTFDSFLQEVTLALSVYMIYTGLINLNFTGNVCVHSNFTAHLYCCLPILQNSSSYSLFDIKTFVVVLCAVSSFPYSQNRSLIIFGTSVLVLKVQYCHRCKQQPNMSIIHRFLFTFFKQHWLYKHLLVNVNDDFYVNILTVTKMY